MSYTFYNLSSKKESSLELKNCTITGNSAAYVVKNGTITKFSVFNGKIDTSQGEIVDRIELTNYQLTLFNLLKGKDENNEMLDDNDLKNLTSDALQTEINNIYRKDNAYKAVMSNVSNSKVELGIIDPKSLNKKITIEFEKDTGLFENLWNKVCNVCKSIKNFFVNLISSQEENQTSIISKSSKIERTQTTPATTITITPNDEHNPITLSNDLGISYSLLKLLNTNLDLNKPLEDGMEVNLPPIKKVIPGSVTNIKETAEASGVSIEYIEDILFRIEGKNGIPALVPYNEYKEKIDKNGYPIAIKGKENNKNGTLTIGFGHTGRVFGEVMRDSNRNSIEITKGQAYELLAADIISAKADAEQYYGEAFTRAPQSIQDAIIDIIFNKGLEKGLGIEKFKDCKKQTLTPQIKKYLENNDYASCISKLIYETNDKGLKKRNYFRLISAMRDLSEKDRNKALQDIESYYQEVYNLFKSNKGESFYIKKAWENAHRGICSGFYQK